MNMPLKYAAPFFVVTLMVTLVSLFLENVGGTIFRGYGSYQYYRVVLYQYYYSVIWKFFAGLTLLSVSALCGNGVRRGIVNPIRGVDVLDTAMRASAYFGLFLTVVMAIPFVLAVSAMV